MQRNGNLPNNLSNFTKCLNTYSFIFHILTLYFYLAIELTHYLRKILVTYLKKKEL